jgi:hypothetical protein
MQRLLVALSVATALTLGMAFPAAAGSPPKFTAKEKKQTFWTPTTEDKLFEILDATFGDNPDIHVVCLTEAILDEWDGPRSFVKSSKRSGFNAQMDDVAEDAGCVAESDSGGRGDPIPPTTSGNGGGGGNTQPSCTYGSGRTWIQEYNWCQMMNRMGIQCIVPAPIPGC